MSLNAYWVMLFLDQEGEPGSRIQGHLNHFGNKMEDRNSRREEALWGKVSSWKRSLFEGCREREARKRSDEAVGGRAEAENSHGVAWAVSSVQTRSQKGDQEEKVNSLIGSDSYLFLVAQNSPILSFTLLVSAYVQERKGSIETEATDVSVFRFRQCAASSSGCGEQECCGGNWRNPCPHFLNFFCQ